jgi:hypothetical protein
MLERSGGTGNQSWLGDSLYCATSRILVPVGMMYKGRLLMKLMLLLVMAWSAMNASKSGQAKTATVRPEESKYAKRAA